MSILSPETSAIVEATATNVQARKAAILFQMWHELQLSPARHLLFDTFAIEDRMIGLLDAIVATAGRARTTTSGPRLVIPLPKEDRTHYQRSIEPALIRALRTALGKEASAMVINAWREAFKVLMHA